MNYSTSAFLPVAPLASPLPARAAAPRSPTMSQQVRAASTSRRAILRAAILATVSNLYPRATQAYTLNESRVTNRLAVLKQSQSKTVMLRAALAKMGHGNNLLDDDILYVQRFVPIWMRPACDEARELGLSIPDVVRGADGGRVVELAASMKGHLLELGMEVKSGKKEGVDREIEEYQQTLGLILDMPILQKYMPREY